MRGRPGPGRPRPSCAPKPLGAHGSGPSLSPVCGLLSRPVSSPCDGLAPPGCPALPMWALVVRTTIYPDAWVWGPCMAFTAPLAPFSLSIDPKLRRCAQLTAAFAAPLRHLSAAWTLSRLPPPGTSGMPRSPLCSKQLQPACPAALYNLFPPPHEGPAQSPRHAMHACLLASWRDALACTQVTCVPGALTRLICNPAGTPPSCCHARPATWGYPCRSRTRTLDMAVMRPAFGAVAPQPPTLHQQPGRPALCPGHHKHPSSCLVLACLPQPSPCSAGSGKLRWFVPARTALCWPHVLRTPPASRPAAPH